MAHKGLVANVVIFNVVHIICGLVAFGLTFSQFTELRFVHSIYIDFRLLNSFHILTGAVGIYMVIKNHGSVVVQSLYLMSLTLGAFSACFYANVFADGVKQYHLFIGLSSLDPSDQEYEQLVLNQKGKLVMAGLMIALGAIEFVAGIASAVLLQMLATEVGPPIGQSRLILRHRGRIGYVAAVKIIFSCVAIGIGGYLEHLYKTRAAKTLAIDKLAAGTVLISGILDVVTAVCRRHHILNLKVSLAFAVAAATFSLKALDYLMSDYFLLDLDEYLDIAEPEVKKGKFTKFVVVACDAGCLILLFIHCIISALENGSNIERLNALVQSPDNFQKAQYVDGHLQIQRNCLGVLQFIWGSGLIALSIISLIPGWETTEGYKNITILWVGVLFLASGSVSAARMQTLCVSVYVFAIVCCVVSIEYLGYAMNMIYQSFTHEKFEENATRVRTGRIALYFTEAGILLLEFFTAIATAIHFSRILQWAPVNFVPQSRSSVRSLQILTVAHFLYALLGIGALIAVLVVHWHFDNESIPPALASLNGMVALGAASVQLLAAKNHKFLLSCALMNIVSGSLVLFILSPVVSALYFNVGLFQEEFPPGLTDFGEGLTPRQRQMLGGILTSAALVFIILIEVLVSVLSAMICSYLLHHTYAINDQQFATLRSQIGGRRGSPNDGKAPSSDELRPAHHRNGKINGGLRSTSPKANGKAGRYYGDEYRTYSGKPFYYPVNEDAPVYVPDSAFYGINGQAPTARADSFAQTNVRHLFHKNANGYVSHISYR